MTEATRAEQTELLREAIRRSGLSNRQFAERVMVRDERTVRRWLAGKQAIPETVLRKLRELGRVMCECERERCAVGHDRCDLCYSEQAESRLEA